MANFTPLDSLGAKNGMSEITAQTTAQRAQLTERDDRGSALIFGVASSSNIFPDEGENIKISSFNAMLDMYEGDTEAERYQGAAATLNPDFSGPVRLGYRETPTIPEIRDNLTDLADQPSYFGPNIASHSIDTEGNPEFSSELAMDQENIKYTNNEDGTINRERGFGTSIGQEATLGSYMRRRWHAINSVNTNEHPRLGEYKDHENLEYSNVAVRVENE